MKRDVSEHRGKNGGISIGNGAAGSSSLEVQNGSSNGRRHRRRPRDRTHEDDGGAAKDDLRRLRRIERRRQRYISILLFVSCVLGLVFMRSAGRRADNGRINRQRKRMMDRMRPRESEFIPNGLKEKKLMWVPPPKRINTDVVAPRDGQRRRDGQESQSQPAAAASVGEAKAPKTWHYRDVPYPEQVTEQTQFWTDPRHLPPTPDAIANMDRSGRDLIYETVRAREDNPDWHRRRADFEVRLAADVMDWEEGFEEDDQSANDESAAGGGGLRYTGPLVDYTKLKYEYPDLLYDLPEAGTYPPLRRFEDMYKSWPQDDIDNPPQPFVEDLLHFDYQDPKQREAAVKFRDAELPFKVYNVPEVDDAGVKWTDEYVSKNFDFKAKELGLPPSHGTCQQSDNNFFAFFTGKNWDVDSMGPPPTLDTDFSFGLWAKHARYADAVGLRPDDVHYYWQSGVPADERHKPRPKWTFVSLDLPSFSSPDPTFFCFDPSKQKGIQCRFGERGVTAASHYDAGRNMVAMITGAKRYVLSPPKACPNLAIVTRRRHPSFRHSMLNFGHMNLLSDEQLMHSKVAEDMPQEEREWLEIAKDAMAIDTVLKAGEVLYIPSHWFHYITSLQKSAQCNVRSGREQHGTKEFGGREDVEACMGEDD